MMNSPFRNIAILVLTVFIASCAELEKYADVIKPTAKLTDTRLTNIDFEKADLVFDLAVNNQNPVAINLAGLNYDLKIEGQSMISGVTARGLEIKPASTSTVQIPVTLRFDDLKKLPGEVWKNDRFGYQLDSEFVVDLPVIGHYAIPVTKQGELPVPKLPAITLKDLQVKNLSLTAAEVVARVEIDNPNDFDLGFSDFNYQLNINQQSWGQGKIDQSRNIPKKGKGTIDIPVRLNLMSMGQTAYQLLSKQQQLEYNLTGGLTLDTGIEMLRGYRMPLDINGKASLN
jgi:LEA14-like dessication related protein